MSLQDERNCDGTEFETVFAETGSIVEAVGYTFTPAVSSAGVISWTNDGGLPNPDPVNIKGANGDDGQDGFSPEVSVETITGGHEVTITDAEGDHTFEVMDGEKGETGEQGEKGDDGDDGFSPTVEVTEITGGHRVTITDAEEAHVFDVMDGQSGGTDVHNDLTGRDAADAHPMSAITGLVTALAGKQDTISDLATIRSGADLGATALQAVPNTYRTAAEQDTIDATKQEKATAVTGTGSVNFTVADNREYSYTGVTSLTMTGAPVECHGFITFGGSTPTISVTGFSGSGGNDITEAAANDVWEFSVFSHDGGSYILWKKWST